MLNPTIQVIPLSDYPLDKLEQEWNSLFNRSAGCFFLSWNWIGSWLSILPTFDDVYVVRAVNCSHSLNGYALDDLLGFGIFCETKVRRHGFVKSKQWHLHRTGNEKLDQIWIEYNDFLLAETAAVNTKNLSNTSNKNLSSQQIRTSMWQSLLTSQPRTQNVDEFIVNVAQTKWFEQLQSDLTSGSTADLTNDLGRFKYLTSSRQPGYKLDLKDNDLMEHFPKKISKSTYNHIKRTFSKLEELNGKNSVTFDIVTAPKQIEFLLTNFCTWHINKWKITNTPSGFLNAHFANFHKLICINAECDDSATTPIAFSISVDSNVKGFIYGFKDKSSFHFYLSSIEPNSDNKIKVGLLLQSMAIEACRNMSLNYYDFLAGEASYKSKLSNIHTSFANLTIQKAKFSFNIERFLRRAKPFLVIK
ncbi:hypothetical protein GCM10009128_24480 [Psychrosphaera haliotis]|uniref:GNAT family N-acetyltransferase n=1 Tax=Psychrosphaera haliotis TaxID=555083 RepID=UPI0031E00B94